MDLISSVLLLAFLYIGYAYVKSKSEIKKEDHKVINKEQAENLSDDVNMINNKRVQLDTLEDNVLTVPEIAHPKKLSSLEEEVKKIEIEINDIKNMVLNVINNSLFFEKVAKWKNDDIFKFIVHKEDVYEFENVLLESQNYIGVNDKKLSFKQLLYKKLEKENADKALKELENKQGEKIVLIDV